MKAGTIVKQVREETGARIRVVEGIPNCDERVIVISAPNLAGRPTHAAQVEHFHLHTYNEKLQTCLQLDRRFSFGELWAGLTTRHDAVVKAKMRRDWK